MTIGSEPRSGAGAGSSGANESPLGRTPTSSSSGMTHVPRLMIRQLADRWPLAMITLGVLITLAWLGVLAWLLFVLIGMLIS